ncbi:MAG: hypothetical protein JWM87_306, partial [Candidatus Eremiobacteraeota bacterium]|nr:hypothetical protein [Candidatus Eremiobacteraeota bacterium]
AGGEAARGDDGKRGANGEPDAWE